MKRASTPSRSKTPRRGAALLELAVVMTLLSMVAVGTVSLGRISYTAMAVTNAARAGAMYGAQSVAKSSDVTGMRNAALNSASADIGTVTVVAGRICYCNATTITCGPPMGACAAGTVRIRDSVTVSKTFTPIIRFPGIPSNISVSRTAKMRVQ